jgi:peptidoglycan/LPS O-acetylase OafA/YrhL
MESEQRWPPTAARLAEIDGIRGWAAVCVLLYHLTWEMFGEVAPSIRNPLTHIFLDGPLAVYVFFVLSGDALSSGFVSTRAYSSLAKGVLKRYFRLTGPIFFSCAIVYALMKLGLTYNTAAARVVGREDWLGVFISFNPDLLELIRYGLIEVYTNHTAQASYNPILWPMSVEMIGSLVVFSFCAVLPHLRRPLAVALSCAVSLWILGSWYSLFFFGLSFSLLRPHGFFDQMRANRRVQILSLVGLVCIGVADGFALSGPATVGDAKYVKPPELSILMATALVFLIYCNAKLISLMRTGFSRYLGKISFPLYLTHFAVILSLTSYEIVEAGNHLSLSNGLFIVTTSIAAALLLADICARLEGKYLGWIDGLLLRHVLARALRTSPAGRTA